MKGFSKESSLIAKGLFILFLLLHHVFAGGVIEIYEINTMLNPQILNNWQIYGKICLGGFSFISAYGITLQLMQAEDKCDIIKVCIKRLIKLESSCCFVYLIAVIYKRYIIQESIRDFYRDRGGSFRPFAMLIDATGLADFFSMQRLNVRWWYLSFAIILIFSMPAFYWLYKKLKISFFFLALICFSNKLIAIVILGIAFAYEGWFSKLECFLERKRSYKLYNFIMCLLSVYISYEIVAMAQTEEALRAIIGVLWIWIVISFLSKIPVLSNGLKIIGKNSTNIFLTHTFVYYYFHTEFIYSFKNAYSIFGVLLIISFGISLILETLKKITKYNDIVEHLIKNILSIIK